MKKSLTLVMLGLLAFAMGLTSFDSSAEARRRHSGRNLAIGLVAGAAAAAIIAGSANASERRSRSTYRAYGDDDGYRVVRRRPTCGQLLDRCNAGSDWACDRYERRC
ncbi:MAG: hypothetical protein ACRCS9_06725 [Hyphomicrobium sp.]